MKKVRKKKRWKLKNKPRFICCIVTMIIVIIAIFQLIATNTSEQQTFACSVGKSGVKPEQKTIYIAPSYTEEEVEMLAKTVYGEAYVTNSQTEMSAVVWCVLNRVDANGYGCGHNIEHVITFPGQFAGYNVNNPVKPEIDALVRDVLNRWLDEKNGVENVGRTLPGDYIFFVGDGLKNHYTKEWKSKDYYDWSLASPYAS